MNYEEEANKKIKEKLENDAVEEMVKLIGEEKKAQKEIEQIVNNKKELQENPKKYFEIYRQPINKNGYIINNDNTLSLSSTL